MATAAPRNACEVRETLKRIQKNLECPICLEMLTDPYNTHCGHPFCRECICTAIARSKAPKCPLCKEPISKRSLSENTMLADIIIAVAALEQAIIKDTGITNTPPRTIPHNQEGTGTPGVLLHSLLHPSPVKPHPLNKQRPLKKESGMNGVWGGGQSTCSAVASQQRKRKLFTRSSTLPTGAARLSHPDSSPSPPPSSPPTHKRKCKSRFPFSLTRKGKRPPRRAEETPAVQEDPENTALLKALEESTLGLPDTQPSPIPGPSGLRKEVGNHNRLRLRPRQVKYQRYDTITASRDDGGRTPASDGAQKEMEVSGTDDEAIFHSRPRSGTKVDRVVQLPSSTDAVFVEDVTLSSVKQESLKVGAEQEGGTMRQGGTTAECNQVRETPSLVIGGQNLLEVVQQSSGLPHTSKTDYSNLDAQGTCSKAMETQKLDCPEQKKRGLMDGGIGSTSDVRVVRETPFITKTATGPALGEEITRSLVVSIPVTYFRKSQVVMSKCVGETPLIRTINEVSDCTSRGGVDILSAAEEVELVKSGEGTGVKSGEGTGVISGEETGVKGGEETGVKGGQETGVKDGEETDVNSGEETGVKGGEETCVMVVGGTGEGGMGLQKTDEEQGFQETAEEEVPQAMSADTTPSVEEEMVEGEVRPDPTPSPHTPSISPGSVCTASDPDCTLSLPHSPSPSNHPHSANTLTRHSLPADRRALWSPSQTGTRPPLASSGSTTPDLHIRARSLPSPSTSPSVSPSLFITQQKSFGNPFFSRPCSNTEKSAASSITHPPQFDASTSMSPCIPLQNKQECKKRIARGCQPRNIVQDFLTSRVAETQVSVVCSSQKSPEHSPRSSPDHQMAGVMLPGLVAGEYTLSSPEVESSQCAQNRKIIPQPVNETCTYTTSGEQVMSWCGLTLPKKVAQSENSENSTLVSQNRASVDESMNPPTGSASVSVIPDSLCPSIPCDDAHPMIRVPTTHCDSPSHSSALSVSQGMTLSSQDLQVLKLQMERKQHEIEELEALLVREKDVCEPGGCDVLATGTSGAAGEEGGERDGDGGERDGDGGERGEEGGEGGGDGRERGEEGGEKEGDRGKKGEEGGESEQVVECVELRGGSEVMEVADAGTVLETPNISLKTEDPSVISSQPPKQENTTLSRTCSHFPREAPPPAPSHSSTNSTSEITAGISGWKSARGSKSLTSIVVPENGPIQRKSHTRSKSTISRGNPHKSSVHDHKQPSSMPGGSRVSPTLLQTADRLLKILRSPPVLISDEQTCINIDQDTITPRNTASLQSAKHASTPCSSSLSPEEGDRYKSLPTATRALPDSALPKKRQLKNQKLRQSGVCKSSLDSLPSHKKPFSGKNGPWSADSCSAARHRDSSSVSKKKKMPLVVSLDSEDYSPSSLLMTPLPSDHPFLTISTTPSLHPCENQGAVQTGKFPLVTSANPPEVAKVKFPATAPPGVGKTISEQERNSSSGGLRERPLEAIPLQKVHNSVKTRSACTAVASSLSTGAGSASVTQLVPKKSPVLCQLQFKPVSKSQPLSLSSTKVQRPSPTSCPGVQVAGSVCATARHNTPPPSFIASSLSNAELRQTKQLARSHGGRLASAINGNTSHLIVRTDQNGCCPRTLKYLQALASGIWIVSYDWVADSIKAGKLLSECDYEVKGDHVVGNGAPHRARTTRARQPGGLFAKYHFILQDEGQQVSNASLAQLIELAGGVVVNGSRVRQTRGTAASTLVVVASGEGVVKGRGLYPVVTSSWILDCISEHRLLDQ